MPKKESKVKRMSKADREERNRIEDLEINAAYDAEEKRKSAVRKIKNSYDEKEAPLPKRAREMPLTDKQAKGAIQALRNDAGSAAYRKRLQENKSKGEESVKKKKMNMGRQATMGGRQNLANEETNRPNFGKDTTNFQYRNAKPPGMARGGAMGGRQNLANEETNRPNFGKDTTNFQYRNAKPPGMSAGGKAGKIRGYGMARGGKACKMM